MPKLFTFSAESFELDPKVEAYFRAKKVIYMDFGSSAYVRSEDLPSILSELVSGHIQPDATSESLAIREKESLELELESSLKRNEELCSNLNLKEIELDSLRHRIDDSAKVLEDLRVENQRLNSLNQRAQPSPLTDNSEALRQSYVKLQKDFQSLRSQNIEAITSLKVLEDENEMLRGQLENLKSQEKAAAS